MKNIINKMKIIIEEVEIIIKINIRIKIIKEMKIEIKVVKINQEIVVVVGVINFLKRNPKKIIKDKRSIILPFNLIEFNLIFDVVGEIS